LAALTDPDPPPAPPSAPAAAPASEAMTGPEMEPDADTRSGSTTDAEPDPGTPEHDALRPIRIRPRDDAEPDNTGGTRRRTLVVIAIVVLVIGAVAGVLIARAIQPFDTDTDSDATVSERNLVTVVDDAATSNDALATTASSAPPTSAPTPPTYPAQCLIPPVPGPDVDGDGCPEAVAIDGRIATVGDRRVELGQDGDLAVVADHDCDGIATPVLFRPDSGELFVFAGWSLDEAVEVDATEVVPDGAGIEAGAGPCPSVTVTDSTGIEHVVAGPGT
ncbi:MAG: hypothetical protein ACSLFO_03430, partial [Acidimicrobiales bacterium]